MIVLDPQLTSDDSTAATERGLRLPSTRTVSRFLHEAQAAVRLRGEVNILLTTGGAIRKLNQQFRGKNQATDVLSFSPLHSAETKAMGLAGDLAISVPTARRQAVEQGHTLSMEIKVLVLHGLLHLAGLDHESDDGKMARREQKLRTLLRLPLGLIERVEDRGASKTSGRTQGAAQARSRRKQS